MCYQNLGANRLVILWLFFSQQNLGPEIGRIIAVLRGICGEARSLAHRPSRRWRCLIARSGVSPGMTPLNRQADQFFCSEIVIGEENARHGEANVPQVVPQTILHRLSATPGAIQQAKAKHAGSEDAGDVYGTSDWWNRVGGTTDEQFPVGRLGFAKSKAKGVPKRVARATSSFSRNSKYQRW